ncbi:MAG: 3-oxoacyl-[acyl-carrier-protein] reductase [Armatimonadota bacterium]|nr:3-oxoacyl-[acyl-carrier-protein] reductase [Armatimonadota bacterium]
MNSLEGRIALVTGASRGIGKAIALALANQGARVACAATKPGGADETAAACGNGSISIVCNIADSASVTSSVDDITKNMGGLHILVNNAGVTRDQLLMRMSDEDWDTVIDVNLKGAYRTIKAAVRPMMKERWGRIINLTSIVGLGGQAGQANYAAAKAGLVGLTKSVAKEFGSRGITCNAIAPGFIETDMTANLPEEMRRQITSTASIARLGTPEDVAATAAFLASDGASYITGQVLVVDGGLTL